MKIDTKKVNGYAVTAIIVIIGFLMSVFTTYSIFERRMDDKIKLHMAPLKTEISWIKDKLNDMDKGD